MGRIYAVPLQGTVANASGDVDLWEFLPAAQKPIKLRGFRLGNFSEFGDAAEEAVRVSVIRLPATVTSGNGGSITPVPLDSADVAAGFTAEGGGATVATTSGSAAIIEELAWNLRMSPLEIWYPDERFCPKVKNAEGLVIRMQSTVADDFSFAGCAWIEEE
jgi:hypothetical protein